MYFLHSPKGEGGSEEKYDTRAPKRKRKELGEQPAHIAAAATASAAAAATASAAAAATARGNALFGL